MSTAWTITVDGESLPVQEGQSLLSVLLARGRLALRHSERSGQPRGPFCGMGLCMDCVVMVEDRGLVRACMERVQDGMVLRTLPRGEGS